MTVETPSSVPAAEALDEAIARLASIASTADELLTLANAYRVLADATDESDDEPKPIHATTDPQMLDVGTSFWAEDRKRMGFRPGGGRQS